MGSISELLQLDTPLKKRHQGYCVDMVNSDKTPLSYEEWLESLLQAQARVLVAVDTRLSDEGHEGIEGYITSNGNKS
jgi:hypothetical protein